MSGLLLRRDQITSFIKEDNDGLRKVEGMSKIADDWDSTFNNPYYGGIPFIGEAEILSENASTPVTIIPKEYIGIEKRLRIYQMFIRVNNADWTHAASSEIYICAQGSGGGLGSPIMIPKAFLTAFTILTLSSPGVELFSLSFQGGNCFGTNGIEIVGDGNFDAGASLRVWVYCLLK